MEIMLHSPVVKRLIQNVQMLRKRDKAWIRWKRNNNQESKEEFKTRNEYVKIRRENEKGYEKDIVEKCKEEHELFYRFVKGKSSKKIRKD